MEVTSSTNPVVLRDPREVPAMEPILAALQRGTGRSTLRALEVVCDKDHRLLEVFGRGDGAVILVARGRVMSADGVRTGPGAIAVVDARQLHFGPDLASIGIRSQCKHRSADVYVNWIDLQLKRGVRRAIWR